MHETVKKERALLVMVEACRQRWDIDALAEEFENLVISTGIEVAELTHIKIREISPSLYIGKGKAQDLSIIVQEEDINVVIFNNNLSFTQQRNLEEAFGVKTIDRTQLILDIFSRHARTQEGSLQVELAQLQYLLPRLKGKGIALSRLGGGIGTRGPGEKKLEVDRRRITDRVTKLKKDIEAVRHHRQVMRKKRQKEMARMCSLVGYTNAGKSTLFNALTDSMEKTSQAMFTTLDTVSRKFTLHDKFKVVVSDTVGFIYDLPLNLVEAFKATLEELHYADILLHVIDAHNKEVLRLRESVDSVLKELNLSSKPVLLVFNKIDKLEPRDLAELEKDYPEAVFISALKKANIKELKDKLYKLLFGDMVEVVLKFPFDLMEMVKYIHKNCKVLKVNYSENEVIYWVRVKKNEIPYLRKKGVSVKEM
jgi:GTP-binding protein HflX